MANSKPLLTVDTNYPPRATVTETDGATDIRQLNGTGKFMSNMPQSYFHLAWGFNTPHLFSIFS
jgi:hypothetical protein